MSALLMSLSFSLLCSSQTDISGIVNTYHRVIEIIPAKACIRLANINGLDVNSYIMIVQMKGATINTTNSASFGDTVSLNQAGNYEIGTVCHIDGDSVFLFHELMNTYNWTSGKVQLVQFGQYYSATVVDTVKAQPWDSTAGTGGVIAIFADQNITLNAPIYADSSGYRGGKYVLHEDDCFNSFAGAYVYNPTTITGFNTGAYKGEGIANLTLNQSGARGAPANGGGGGNNHNNSGGGGANLSAGGRGGGNSSNSGNCSTPRRGEAGKALGSWGGTKVFAGGGGGAGHANHGIYTKGGGHGGGIIFIWASNIIGNGHPISANGADGGQSQSDGAGGGGAGGTIILNVGNYFGPATIRANGGNGGNSNDAGNVGYCYGGGGGGAGGVIYFSGPIPGITTQTVTAGLAGVESGRDVTCATEQPSLPGTVGSIFSGYTFSRSFEEASYCELLLPVNVIQFNALLVSKKVLLKWEIANPEMVSYSVVERSADGMQWTALSSVSANDQIRDYTNLDNTPLPGKSYYRIRFVEKNNSSSYSPIRFIVTGTTDDFTVYPNPANGKLTIKGNQILPASVNIFDLSGRNVLQTTISSATTSIDLPPVPAGIYFLKVNQSVQKIMIH